MYFSLYTTQKIILIKYRWVLNWLLFPFRKTPNNLQKSKTHLHNYQKIRNTGPEPVICHAPSRSIYFGFEGKVIPCCFNREFIYGKYPEISIKEIIEGGSRKLLQNYLSNEDFSHGCEHCLKMINTGNYEGVEARLYDGLKKQKGGFPAEMIFEIDNTCNLECVMCEGRFSSSILKNREGKDYTPGPYDASFVEQLIPYLEKLEVAKFLGGEPFLIKQYYDIWEIILKVNPKCIINLQTNGTVYNEKIEKLLKRGHFQIGVSLDSLNKSRFEEIRKPAVFENVINNIDKFINHTRKAGCFTNISVCPMRINAEEIPRIVEFCNSKKVFVYFNTVYTKKFSLMDWNSSEIGEIYKLFNNTRFRDKGYLAKRNINSFRSLTRQIGVWYKFKLKEETRLIKRHHYHKIEFIALFEKKIIGSDTALKEKLLRNLQELPQEILLSDAHLEHLQQIPNEEFAGVLVKETDSELQKLLHNFFETGNFLYKDTDNDLQT